MKISDDFDIPAGLKTRKVFSLAAKIISSQFYQIQRLCFITETSSEFSMLPPPILFEMAPTLPYMLQHVSWCMGYSSTTNAAYACHKLSIWIIIAMMQEDKE